MAQYTLGRLLKEYFIDYLPTGNHSVVGIPESNRAAAIASFIANAITTDKHIGGSPVADKEENH